MKRRVTLDDAITRYLELHRNTPGTQRAYEQTLRQAQTMLARQRITRLDSLALGHVQDLFFSEKVTSSGPIGWPGTPNPPAWRTKNNHLSRLKTFFGWCVQMGYMKQQLIFIKRRGSDAGTFARFKGPEAEKRRFSQKEVDLILASAHHPRDRAIIAVCGYAGLRISEVVTCRVRDFLPDPGMLKFYDDKTEKRKDAPLYEEGYQELCDWLDIYREMVGELKDDMYLFPRIERPTFTGSRSLTPTLERKLIPHERYEGKYDMLRRLLDEIDEREGREGAAKLSVKGQKFHMFRRSIARLTYDRFANSKAGASQALRNTQLFLQHEDVKNTQAYIGLDVEREAVNKHIRRQSLSKPIDEDTTIDHTEITPNVIRVDFRREA